MACDRTPGEGVAGGEQTDMNCHFDKRTPGMTGIPVINDKILIFNIILLNINSSN